MDFISVKAAVHNIMLVPVYCSIASIWVALGLTQVQLKRYLASVSRCSTNQIVQKFTSGIKFD